MGRFLRLFTELPLGEIARLEALQGAEMNEAKKVLATEVTALCHGREAADDGRGTAKKTFEKGGASEGLPTVDGAARPQLEAGRAGLRALLAGGPGGEQLRGPQAGAQGGAPG